MNPLLYIIIVLGVLGLGYGYWLTCRWMASRLIMVFVAQSFFVRDIPAQARPKFVIDQCLRHNWEVKRPFRALAMWYISNRGYYYATSFLKYIIDDARENDQLELAE